MVSLAILDEITHLLEQMPDDQQQQALDAVRAVSVPKTTSLTGARWNDLKSVIDILPSQDAEEMRRAVEECINPAPVAASSTPIEDDDSWIKAHIGDISPDRAEAMRRRAKEEREREVSIAQANLLRGSTWKDLEPFFGCISAEDAETMRRVIEEDCERIDPDGW